MSATTERTSTYVTERRDVKGFSGIALRGTGRIRLQQTGKESLGVRAPKRWMHLIETRVKDGMLLLGFKRRLLPFIGLARMRGEIEFLIDADVIEDLSISGAGSFEVGALRSERLCIDISGAGDVDCHELDAAHVVMRISGSGKIKSDRYRVDETRIKSSGSAKISLLDVVGSSLHTTLSGSGRIEASGTVRDTELRISGSGSLWLDKLEVNRCQARISGSGKIRVHATDTLDATVSGAGSILYKGDPQLSVRTSGTGRIHRIEASDR